METVNSNSPSGLMNAIRYYSDPLVCVKEVASVKWPKGEPVCPRCGSKRHSFLKTRLMWKCLECRKQYSVKVGTIFEDSPYRSGQMALRDVDARELQERCQFL